MTRHLLRTLTCGMLLALGAVWAGAEPIVETLDNGCRVVVEEDHSRPVAALRVYVGVGSALEGRTWGHDLSTGAVMAGASMPRQGFNWTVF